MEHIFGDDGFRSVYGNKYMSNKFLNTFSYTLNEVFRNKIKCKFAIGYDTRFSNKEIFNKITKYLQNNITIVDLGIVTLGQLSYEINKNKFYIGIMITASHFHYSYNGIKILNHLGEKIEPSFEKRLEKKIKSNLNNYNNLKFSFQEFRKLHNYNSNYHLFIKKNLINLKKRYLIDCANGSASKLFKSIGRIKMFKYINNNSNGKNINLKSGAFYYLKKNLISNLDYTIHFDGDADRVIIKSKKYGHLSPEFLIFLYCYKFKKELKIKKVVASEIVNSSLVKHLNHIGINLYLTKVGDRNVYNKMKKLSADIGFEPSGHYSFNGQTNTMDGIYSFFKFIKILEDEETMEICNQLFSLRNRITHTFNPKNNISTKFLKELNTQLNLAIENKNEYILLRRSIWSSKLKIYYDYEIKNNFKKIRRIINNI